MDELFVTISLLEVEKLACSWGYYRAVRLALEQCTPGTITLNVSAFAQIWATIERCEGSDTLRSDLRFLRELELVPAISTRRGVLSGLDLSGANLSGLDLSGVDFGGVHLRGARYSAYTRFAADLDVRARGLVRECNDCYDITTDHDFLCAECQSNRA